MTPNERRRAFGKERTRQLRAFGKLTAQPRARIVRELNAMRDQIVQTLRAQPTEWQTFHLTRVRREVEAALARFERAGSETWREATRAAWERGVSMVDAPLAAGGIDVAAMLPRISDAQLSGIQAFTTDRIRNISGEARERINAQLLATLSGVQSPSETIEAVQRVLGSSRKRAITITRTELGRAFSISTQRRQEAAAKRVPGLKKQWRRSGKLFSRIEHDAADGQVREVDEPFSVGGELLMHPRDPTASAKQTINCGCVSLPYKEEWDDDVSAPGKRAFTKEEVGVQPMRRDLEVAVEPLPVTAPFLTTGIKGTPGQTLRTDSPQLRAFGRFLQDKQIKSVFLKQSETFRKKRGRSAQHALEKSGRLSEIADYLGWSESKTLTYVTARGRRVKGFTFKGDGFDHVVVKTKAGTDFGKVRMQELRAAVDDGIRAYTEGSVHRSGQRAWSFSEMAEQGSPQQQTLTWLHELGHQVHFKAGAPRRPPVSRALTEYSTYNGMEWHAEHFVAWVLDRDALARWDEDVAKHFDELMAPYIGDDG